MIETFSTMLQATGTAFSWSENSAQIIIAGLLSMLPAFEGRYAVTVAMGMGMPVLQAFLLALVCSTIPMPFILLLLKPILKWFYTLPIKPIRKFAEWVEKRSVKKAGKVDGQGLIGLFIFVALPLPGTGVWTGSGIASLLEMNRVHAGIAIFAGNVVACLIMTLLAYGVISIF